MPHSDHSPSDSSSIALPPFPDDIPTAPLLRISLAKLLAHDVEEAARCYSACETLGFFYLDLSSGSTDLFSTSASLFSLMETFFALPVAEKEKYDFKSEGSYFGYKGYGEGFVDAKGTRDRNEFYNTSKDDILGLGSGGRLPAPECLSGEKERETCEVFIRSCHSICMTIVELLESKLSLKSKVQDTGGLRALHHLDSVSGDQIRFIRAPPQPQTEKAVALGEHTDFGSVTVLFNRLGGLQVHLPPHISPIPPAATSPPTLENPLCKDGWCYVRPLPAHVVINLGDALVKFSNGALRSNTHRVVAPPGGQGAATRYSLVYFCRPGDDVVLSGLVEGVGGEEGEEGVTAKEWILRRALGRREQGGWEGSGGTEGSVRVGGMRA